MRKGKLVGGSGAGEGLGLPGPGSGGFCERPGGVPVRWMSPGELAANPWNVRRHPARQKEEVRELLRRQGWLVPVLWNEEGGRLVNGHLRLEVCLEEGWWVPVWSGRWGASEEAEILAFLDASGSGATVDLAGFAGLLERMGGGLGESGALVGLAETIRTDPFFQRGAGGAAVLLGQAPPRAEALPAEEDGERAGDVEGDGPEDGEELGQVGPVSPSQRMVPLYLSPDGADEFERLTDVLMGVFAVDTPTECVLMALRHCQRELC